MPVLYKFGLFNAWTSLSLSLFDFASPVIFSFFGDLLSEVLERKQLLSMAAFFRAFLDSPVGPKTTHFWGPVANWGFVAAGLVDMEKPPEMISGNMTGAMCVCSALLMRFAWMVRPRNYLLLACHASNETVQLYQLSRWAKGQGYFLSEKKEETKSQIARAEQHFLDLSEIPPCPDFVSSLMYRGSSGLSLNPCLFLLAMTDEALWEYHPSCKGLVLPHSQRCSHYSNVSTWGAESRKPCGSGHLMPPCLLNGNP
ncbi:UPF0041 BRAIN PROTEIN 44-RELATED [Salix koriyanagi]|uniref:Mitochondrial pyruvate carrier n=1 Tax=Salix koriyanagi TaxID=2511006 RepID=A0A9Q0SSD5_9ROSI|nr:UPF0041 BRAIN PROTEIN 44-RELATED [Salix koriyanagi]